MDIFFTVEIPYLIEGAKGTLILGISCVILSTLLGVLMGIINAIGPSALKAATTVYINIVRGIPLIVVIFLFHFGVPFLGFHLNPIIVAVLAISTYMGALIAEIVRGGINSVPRGQFDAGRALGYEDFFVIAHIILPQSIRYVLPPYISFLPVTIKATALASVVSVWELTLASREVVARTYDAFPVFGASMAIYFLINYPLTKLSTTVESRLTKIAW